MGKTRAPIEAPNPAEAPATGSPAAPLPARIEPTADNPEPLPQTSGAWARDDDGGLRPLDATTAAAAGLAAPTEEPATATE